ncbi:MAG: quinone-dependent dihydroorotate dehydrogenase [Acidobacteria bacterium]|nr:quinone-dependent dihydroorotate dehydrogenase [Acidobacteriota bacterium]
MPLYTRCLRPLLFRADPELIHDRALAAASLAGRLPAICPLLHAALHHHDPALAVDTCGLRFHHPLGLAAGFDKNGRAIPLWQSLGFSHVEIGSISAHPSAGNPKPRLFRLPQDRAIVVNYGLPNHGAARVAQRLALIRNQLKAPLGVNLVNTNRGPAAPPETDEQIIRDYATSFTTLQPLCAYIVLNLSCPNTCDGRAFVSDLHRVRALLDAIAAVRPAKPVFLKIAPFSALPQLDSFLDAVSAYPFLRGFSINLPPGKPPGLTASPDQLQRMPGAVSGAPAEAAANQAIAHLYRRIDPARHIIIGSGGIFTPEDAWRKITLGATLLQALTALVYEGPAIVHRIAAGLSQILRREGFTHTQQAVGSAVRP